MCEKILEVSILADKSHMENDVKFKAPDIWGSGK